MDHIKSMNMALQSRFKSSSGYEDPEEDEKEEISQRRRDIASGHVISSTMGGENEMDQTELRDLLTDLINRWECETIEFKRAESDFSTSEPGKYFSALSNESNLRNCDSAWLVFGVDDKTREITGTDYRQNHERLQSLKMQIAVDTDPSITLRNIHELQHPDGRVILFEIPPAPRGIPIAWKGHYYARAGESLTSLGLDKQDKIRQQTIRTDWTAEIIAEATLENLDAKAVQKAREYFAEKYANRFPSDEVMNWPLATFLDRAKITQQGHVTRTALLLLGKQESAYLLSPNPAQITWKLDGPENLYSRSLITSHFQNGWIST